MSDPTLRAALDAIEVNEDRVRAFSFRVPTTEVIAAAASVAERAAASDRHLRLAGMPVAVKEIIDVAHLPTTFGSAVFADRVPSADAVAVSRLRAAGAVIVGMTTTTPFACGTTTVTDNPLAPGHTPGGSSAGSGAAVGAGFATVALASQSQASTLRPASYCGVWGFKPSHLRLPRAGMHLLADVLDDLGVIASSHASLHAAFEVLAEPRTMPLSTERLARLRRGEIRIGRLRLDDGGLPTDETLGALDSLVAFLGEVFEVTGSDDDDELGAMDAALVGSGLTCFDLFAAQSAAVLAEPIAAGEPDPRLVELVTHAESIGPDGLERALAHRDELRFRWAELESRFDVIISLSTTNQAPLGHETTGCRRMPATSSLLGVPALSAPWLTVGGLPQGVQLLGFEGRDEELFALADVLDQRVTDWSGPDPDVADPQEER